MGAYIQIFIASIHLLSRKLTLILYMFCSLIAYVTKLGMEIIHALCINSALTSLKLNGNKLGEALLLV